MMSDIQPPEQLPADVVGEVQTLLRAGDLARATFLARRALDEGTVDPLLLHVRAHWLEQQGRVPEALDDLARGVMIAPNDPLAHYAFGVLAAKVGETERAIGAFSAAISLKPDYAPAYRHLGEARCGSGEVAAGRALYQKALELNPNDADSLAALAELAQRQGDDETAKDFIERALAIAPGQRTALTVQATMALAAGSLGRAEHLAKGLAADAKAGPVERAIAMGLIGDIRHAQKRYGEAFEAYTTANDWKFDVYAPRFDRAGGETAFTYALWLQDYLDVAPAAQWRAAAGALDAAGVKAHVFMAGFPRSGTTLVQNILEGHPDVVALQEHPLLQESLRDFLSNDEGRRRLATLGPDGLATYRAHYWQRVAARGIDVRGRVFVDNRPLSSLQILLVAKLFPDAKVMFMLRDPRDVVLSCFRSAFAMGPATFEFLKLDRAARLYGAVMELCESYRDVLGLAWHDLHHETLVDEFDGELDRLCRFIGIDPRPEMRDFAERAKTRDIHTRSAPQVRRELNREGIGQWQNYAADMKPVLSTLKPWVRKLGYDAG
jgi:tetratricopeptide (TPR) repeat protein